MSALPWLMAGLGALLAAHLVVMLRISQYHQRVLKVKSGTWLFPASLGVVAVALGGAVAFPGPMALYTFHLLGGLCLGLCGLHLAHTMLVK